MTSKFKAKPKHTQLGLHGRITISEIRNQAISNKNKLHSARWFVKLFGGNRKLCLPHCLSLFGMFIYRPINGRARPVRYCSNAIRSMLSVCLFVAAVPPPPERRMWGGVQPRKMFCSLRSLHICTSTLKIVAPPLAAALLTTLLGVPTSMTLNDL